MKMTSGRIIQKDDPYKTNIASKFDDMVLNDKPILRSPVYVLQVKGVEKK